MPKPCTRPLPQHPGSLRRRLAAAPEQVAAYLTELADTHRLSVATLRLHRSSVGAVHRNAGFDDRTAHGGVSQGRAGRMETAGVAGRRGLVDIALASTLRDGLLRRSEAAALRRGDVELLADGSGRLHVRQSKGDQEGSGAVLYLGPDAVRDLLAIRPPGVVTDAQAPVFGLSASQIGRRPRAAAQLHDHLAGPGSELFVAASALPVAAFRGRQHGEKGQGPIASRPGDMAKPHQGDPAQATGLDQMAPAGTHRIAVDAQGFDFRATAPFQGFVDAEDQRTIALIQVLEQ